MDNTITVSRGGGPRGGGGGGNGGGCGGVVEYREDCMLNGKVLRYKGETRPIDKPMKKMRR